MDRSISGQSGVRRALREATAPVHERLHAAPPFAALSRQRLGMRGYTDLLSTIAAFHFGAGETLGLGGTRRALLERDLEALGVPAPVAMPWSLPGTPAARLGSAYVVEGSCLGGKVIFRQLDYLFGESVAGRSFFRGSASDGARWRELCGRLEAEGASSRALGQMIAGAAAAFARFEHLISRVPAYG